MSEALRDRIRRAAVEAHPLECCGLLVGMGEAVITVLDVIPTPNVADHPERAFAVDPQRQFEALRATREDGARIVGHYHSHPNGVAMPSVHDLDMAHDPNAVWVIVTASDLRGFRCPGDGAFVEIPLLRIETGYTVNVLARCLEMQTRYYARAHGFGQAFETVVAAGLADFSPRMEKSCNRLWRAMLGERIVGTIVVDGEDMAPGIAHLRWFVIDDDVRGAGIGRQLLSLAIAFCDAHGFAEAHLWSFVGLDAARKLYDTTGFVVAEERVGDQWGKEVIEQRFVRKRPF
jgi:proteasome lid subunit RPN8/RPN11/GNAT superfamily N-acetyltransferase